MATPDFSRKGCRGARGRGAHPSVSGCVTGGGLRLGRSRARVAGGGLGKGPRRTQHEREKQPKHARQSVGGSRALGGLARRLTTSGGLEVPIAG